MGQRARFDNFYRANAAPINPSGVPATQAQFQVPATSNPAAPVVPNTAQPGFGQPPVGQPTFGQPPMTGTPPPTTLQLPAVTAPPPGDPFAQGFGTPLNQPPASGFQQTPPVGTPFYSGAIGYGQPSSSSWQASTATFPPQSSSQSPSGFLPRLFERPRIRYTYIDGNGKGSELGLNELEIATTMNFANWFGSNQPLRVSPGFIFHSWNGPNTPDTGFDLPPITYSAYVATDFVSDTNKTTGFESNFTFGFYSDFKNVSQDSWRFTGVGLGWMRLNSYTVGKLGFEYFDRVDLKILPAFGVFMAPNSDIKFDLYFPRPKLAHRIPMSGLDTWLFIGAEYGGGSWTIERLPGFDDQVDVNDVRSFIGIEWMGPSKTTGIMELGVLFNRKMVYRSAPPNTLSLKDSFMFRLGLAY